MTKEQFKEFINVTIPCALFHVGITDKDDTHGGRLDETILVKLIAENAGCLKHKSLSWFVYSFITVEENSEKTISKNFGEEDLFNKILNDERNEWDTTEQE